MPDDRDYDVADELDQDLEVECGPCGKRWWILDQGEFCPICGSSDWTSVRDWA